ncbi:MAG: polysaccharide deacetylase family protein [Candidatus Omnitrophota bacterium]|nr:polysaccharide deacetylase family protein [Candidatus Omnitrophota bacterium]
MKDLISIFFYILSFLIPQSKESVLLYHSISGMNSKQDSFNLNISTELFKKHMAYLAGLRQKREFLVTFDDGFENFFTNAYPVLLRYNIKSILFIAVDFVDKKISLSDFCPANVEIRPLSWEQIKEISNNGIEIGSHSLSHPDLLAVDSNTAKSEIAGSKERTEAIIGKKIKYFAYPYGSKRSYNSAIKKIVKESGYEKAYSNIMGFNTKDTDPYDLRRIRIYTNDNMFRFKMKTRGAYNWVDFLIC